MKIPYFAGNGLCSFLKSARVVGSRVSADGEAWKVVAGRAEAPSRCPRPGCGHPERMRRNGSYGRIVIEGLVRLVLLICRFRCKRCGKSVSRPPSFLVPYKRFTARLIASAVQKYAEQLTTYDEVSAESSVFRDDGEALAIQPPRITRADRGYCPATSTTFSWIDYLSKRSARWIQQVQKELVIQNRSIERLPDEGLITNANGWKSGRSKSASQVPKRQELNKLSYVLVGAEMLLDGAVENLV
jgi:hypothetical protein